MRTDDTSLTRVKLSTGFLLLVWSIILAIVILLLVHGPLQMFADAHDQLEQQLGQSTQPYGGCDEAWQAPDSAGAQWCKDHGLYPE